jgi:hypothetical protein
MPWACEHHAGPIRVGLDSTLSNVATHYFLVVLLHTLPESAQSNGLLGYACKRKVLLSLLAWDWPHSDAVAIGFFMWTRRPRA